ncbi:MAG: DUF4834 domain-containing protein [Prevotella sp.]|nr:DUF4834 domain-containing protein [Prevotella sp.]
MAIIQFLLFLFLFAIFAILFAVLFFAAKARQIVNRFKKQATSQQHRTEGNVVIDQRDPQKANRKIIPKDEGEYIDFTEE